MKMNQPDFKLKFTYKAFRAEFPIFDYKQNDFITIDACIKKYGEDVFKKAFDNPGRVVEQETKERVRIVSVERMIKA